MTNDEIPSEEKNRQLAKPAEEPSRAVAGRTTRHLSDRSPVIRTCFATRQLSWTGVGLPIDTLRRQQQAPRKSSIIGQTAVGAEGGPGTTLDRATASRTTLVPLARVGVAEARKRAQAAGRKGTELREAVNAAMKLADRSEMSNIQCRLSND